MNNSIITQSARYSISFNGSLIGYFKGKRGIRQGNPLSRFLFVLSMNVLSRILNLAAARGVTIVLDNFYEMSGLKLNAAKCELYVAGISTNILGSITKITGFKQGCLPVRYLGVPLVTRKLSEKDCRLELIRAVLFSVANFWCRQLFVPQSIIKKIEQLCSRFFWKSSDKASTGARVSWATICHSKSEGGLCLKDIKTWNKV
ncbi:uncharacterized protein LOC120173726 [Hibiscus syriacus]|uniref:uncharacterized protein LOC120173726 n=1 Tax=Hibiscus syriacus TaxID=106335 RepID=UPI001922EE0F|nr:uncharacterized protein LOC120173726 [Hibiscus syriacus]